MRPNTQDVFFYTFQTREMPPTRGYYQSFQFRHFRLRHHTFKIGDSVLHQSLSVVLNEGVVPLGNQSLSFIWAALCAASACPECVCFQGRDVPLPIFFSRDLCLMVEGDELCRFAKLLVTFSCLSQLF